MVVFRKSGGANTSQYRAPACKKGRNTEFAETIPGADAMLPKTPVI
jgi:hypothetical protein